MNARNKNEETKKDYLPCPCTGFDKTQTAVTSVTARMSCLDEHLQRLAEGHLKNTCLIKVN